MKVQDLLEAENKDVTVGTKIMRLIRASATKFGVKGDLRDFKMKGFQKRLGTWSLDIGFYGQQERADLTTLVDPDDPAAAEIAKKIAARKSKIVATKHQYAMYEFLHDLAKETKEWKFLGYHTDSAKSRDAIKKVSDLDLKNTPINVRLYFDNTAESGSTQEGGKNVTL